MARKTTASLLRLHRAANTNNEERQGDNPPCRYLLVIKLIEVIGHSWRTFRPKYEDGCTDKQPSCTKRREPLKHFAHGYSP